MLKVLDAEPMPIPEMPGCLVTDKEEAYRILIGKNYTDGVNDLVTGSELLILALNVIRNIQYMAGQFYRTF
ncbi:MAG: hypothetical protein IJG65_08545 [Synergistaceae bacterium]|nr:hypothetical protein [Synergistaceae bacterium]